MKNAIYVLIIGGIMVLSGYAMREGAKSSMKFGYTYQPPYANAEEERVATLYNVGGYMQFGSVLVLLAGGLMLVVAAIEKSKNGTNGAPTSAYLPKNEIDDSRSNFCTACGKKVLDPHAKFCNSCGMKF